MPRREKRLLHVRPPQPNGHVQVAAQADGMCRCVGCGGQWFFDGQFPALHPTHGGAPCLHEACVIRLVRAYRELWYAKHDRIDRPLTSKAPAGRPRVRDMGR